MLRSLFVLAAVVGFSELWASQAQAQYSVYIKNCRRPSEGWYRSGNSADVNKSYAVCVRSINQRIAENRRYRTDWEAFGISAGTAQRVTRPQYILYVPAGYRVQLKPLGDPTTMYAMANRLQPALSRTGKDEEV